MSDGPQKTLPPPKLDWPDYLKQLWSRCAKVCNEAKLNFRATPWRSLVVVVGFFFAIFLVYWIFEKIFIYFIARSYVEEIADVFNLNKHLADAIVYLTFVAIAICLGMIFRFSRQKRLIGVFGIIGLLVAHSLIMAVGESGQIIKKCYVITRDSVRYGERPGTDPGTGRQCRPVTAELVERLRAYEKGDRPKRIVENEPVFFDSGRGEPIVWYYKDKDGKFEIFNLMGFHPDTGKELLPITREIVDAWKLQKEQDARLAPKHIDPEKYAFFDPITGKPRVWYWRSANGDYEFYDRSGFHQATGEPLTIVSRDLIDAWRKYVQEAASQKCYIITRDAVRYSSPPGIDPVTGRQCRLLTPEILERLREYEKGNRPKPIKIDNPTFFDLRTGEPIVWYYKNKNDIELFDLMGFHPQTGDELLPVTREIADLWKTKKTSASAQTPQRVDPEKYAFFDPVSGKARVWYWRSQTGEYEFYDNPGFHPRTGEQLKVITSETIGAYKIDTDKRTQRDKDSKTAEESARELDRNASALCDQLAANPRDPKKAAGASGVSYDSLKYQAKDAVEACGKAVQQYPNELRYHYQFARASEFSNPDKALERHLNLGRMEYAAAYDNAGGLLLRQKKYSEALRQFQLGAQHGDADAMVSWAEMIKKGRAEGNYIDLYQRAASLGHEGAQLALQQEQQQQLEIQQQGVIAAQRQQQGIQMMNLILRNIGR
jgi:hypothetical protein